MNNMHTASIPPHEVTSAIAGLRRLTNTQLREILRDKGLAISGVKNALIARLTGHIQALARDRDMQAFVRLANEIDPRRASAIASLTASSARSVPPSNPSYSTKTVQFQPHLLQQNHVVSRGPGVIVCPFTYKKSPFYSIQEVLSPPLEFRRLEHNRETLSLNFTLSDATIGRLALDKSLRIVLYCATEAKLEQTPGTPRNISFPQNIELRINGEEFKANMKGLKNKPGTTKPADITAFVRTKLPNFKNNITIGYALTKERYFLNVMLVQKKTVQELTTILQHGKYISKQQVINEMKTKASDPDIVATSTVLSLKDPISYLRLKLPCRSTFCTHIQCFEVGFFLELQEQAPQWSCPICSKPTPFESLAVDQYVVDILQNTSNAVEQVTVEPDGHWRPVIEDSTRKPGNGDDDDDDYDDDDDDVLEIAGPKGGPIKTEVPPTPISVLGYAPPLANATSTTQPQPSSGVGTKRRSEVIDLTISDDEAPAPKRPMLQSTHLQSTVQPKQQSQQPNSAHMRSNLQSFLQQRMNTPQYSTKMPQMNGSYAPYPSGDHHGQVVSPYTASSSSQNSATLDPQALPAGRENWPQAGPWGRSSSTQSGASANGGGGGSGGSGGAK